MDPYGITSTAGKTTVFRFLTTGTLSILVLAILVGLATAYAIRSLLIAEKAPEPALPETINVPLASADLPVGRTIRLGDVILVPMTREQLNNQDWPIQRVMLSSEQVFGRTLREPLQQGKPFLTSGMFLEGSGPEYTDLLKPGFRAVSLIVPLSRGGYANPGSFVDVVFRTTPREGDESAPAIPEATMTLIQGAEILAVERPRPATGLPGATGGVDLRSRQTSGQESPPTVVLAVTTEEANRLQAVHGRGEISLVSRPPGETDIDRPLGPITLEDILGISRIPPELMVAAAPFHTEIYRRTQLSVNTYELEGGRYLPVSSQNP